MHYLFPSTLSMTKHGGGLIEIYLIWFNEVLYFWILNCLDCVWWNVMLLSSLHLPPFIQTVGSYWLAFSHKCLTASVRSEQHFNIENNARDKAKEILQNDLIISLDTKLLCWIICCDFCSATFISSDKNKIFCIIFNKPPWN